MAEKLKFWTANGGGVKSTKNQVKNVRNEVETKNQKETAKGPGNNLKISLEAEKSMAGVDNIKQGVSILDIGKSKIICDGVGVIGNRLNSMMEWNVECAVLLEKKTQKRVLPKWILEGGKRSEPPDTEKTNSAEAEKNVSQIEDLVQIENVKIKKNKKNKGVKKANLKKSKTSN